MVKTKYLKSILELLTTGVTASSLHRVHSFYLHPCYHTKPSAQLHAQGGLITVTTRYANTLLGLFPLTLHFWLIPDLQV